MLQDNCHASHGRTVGGASGIGWAGRNGAERGEAGHMSAMRQRHFMLRLLLVSLPLLLSAGCSSLALFVWQSG